MRLKQFQTLLSEKKINSALFISMGMEYDPNLFYFSGYSGVGALIIPKSGSPTLLAPKMETERAKKSAIKNIETLEKKKLFESISIHLGKEKSAIGIDGSAFSYGMAKSLKKSLKKASLKDISLDAERIRMIKTSKEIDYLKTSCDFADKILQKTFSEFSEFKTESDVASFLQYQTFKNGLDISFKPIVGSGKNGSMPHYTPQNIKLNKGLCVIDFGVKYKGYCSDITRTVGIKMISKEEKETYQNLLSIQKKSISDITEGKSCSKIYDEVVSALGDDSPYFTHGLGHGVGVEIHELPNLTLNSKDTIQNDMVFTIEPGVYFPKKFGIRIEDTVLFKNKPTPLTKTTKELQILG